MTHRKQATVLFPDGKMWILVIRMWDTERGKVFAQNTGKKCCLVASEFTEGWNSKGVRA